MVILQINPESQDLIIKDTCRLAGRLGLFPEFNEYLQNEELFNDQWDTLKSYLNLPSVVFLSAYDTETKEQAFSIVRYPAYDVHIPGPGLVMMFTVSGTKDYRLIGSIYRHIRKVCSDLKLKWYMDSRKVGLYRYENRYHVLE